MSYQGARARTEASEAGRVFAVSKVRLDHRGEVSQVLWHEVNGRSDTQAGLAVEAPAADVVTALHAGAQVEARFREAGHARQPERRFRVVAHADGHETLALVDAATPGREMHDIDKLDGTPRDLP